MNCRTCQYWKFVKRRREDGQLPIGICTYHELPIKTHVSYVCTGHLTKKDNAMSIYHLIATPVDPDQLEEGYHIYVQNGIPADQDFDLPAEHLHICVAMPGETAEYVCGEIKRELEKKVRRGNLQMGPQDEIRMSNLVLKSPLSEPWMSTKLPNCTFKKTANGVGVVSIQLS